MSKLLSDSEVKELLSAISNGSLPDNSVPEKKSVKHVKIYDFRRPDKLSVKDVKNIVNVMESFARSFGSSLNGEHICDKKIFVRLSSVDQLTLEEFYRSLPSPYIVETFKISDKFCVMELDTNVALAILGNAKSPSRTLTDHESEIIEKSVMHVALQKYIDSFNNAESFFGKNRINITGATDLKFSNNDYPPAWSNREMCCSCAFEIYIGESNSSENVDENGESTSERVGGLFNVTIISDLAKELSKKMEGNEKDIETKNKIDENLVKNTRVPVEVVLGATNDSLKDILDYKPGKVIELDKLAGEPVEIRANGAVIGTGEVVVLDEKYGVRITELK